MRDLGKITVYVMYDRGYFYNLHAGFLKNEFAAQGESPDCPDWSYKEPEQIFGTYKLQYKYQDVVYRAELEVKCVSELPKIKRLSNDFALYFTQSSSGKLNPSELIFRGLAYQDDKSKTYNKVPFVTISPFQTNFDSGDYLNAIMSINLVQPSSLIVSYLLANQYTNRKIAFEGLLNDTSTNVIIDHNAISDVKLEFINKKTVNFSEIFMDILNYHFFSWELVSNKTNALEKTKQKRDEYKKQFAQIKAKSQTPITNPVTTPSKPAVTTSAALKDSGSELDSLRYENTKGTQPGKGVALPVHSAQDPNHPLPHNISDLSQPIATMQKPRIRGHIVAGAGSSLTVITIACLNKIQKGMEKGSVPKIETLKKLVDYIQEQQGKSILLDKRTIGAICTLITLACVDYHIREGASFISQVKGAIAGRGQAQVNTK